MIYFLVYLFLEVMISTKVSSAIGGFATFAEIIFSAVVGFALIANFRVTFMQSLQALASRTITPEEFQKLNAWSILGALLLIMPGFLTDVVGVLLQFSSFATLFASKILHVKSFSSHTHFKSEQTHFKKGREDDVIDVEIVSDNRLK